MRAWVRTIGVAAAVVAICWPAASTAGADGPLPALPFGAHQGVASLDFTTLPSTYGPDTAVVILGYGLTPEGTLREELVRRLRAGLMQAVFAPLSPVIVTGGNPQSGVREADAMADWLVANGLPEARILREPEAASTVENARRTADLLREHGLRDAVLVTSGDHLARARAAFLDAGVTVAGARTPEQTVWPFGPLGDR
ncbi:YdcF family protein [Nocardia thailandica]